MLNILKHFFTNLFRGDFIQTEELQYFLIEYKKDGYSAYSYWKETGNHYYNMK